MIANLGRGTRGSPQRDNLSSRPSPGAGQASPWTAQAGRSSKQDGRGHPRRNSEIPPTALSPRCQAARGCMTSWEGELRSVPDIWFHTQPRDTYGTTHMARARFKRCVWSCCGGILTLQVSKPALYNPRR